MSKANNEKADFADTPSAPSAPSHGAFDPSAPFSHRAPPPSYEETQRMSGTIPGQPQYAPYGQPQPQYPPAASGFQTAPSSSYAAGSAYQWQPPPPMQQQYYQHNYPAVPQISPMMTTQTTMYAAPNNDSANPKVLELAKGAKIRTTATGAVSIPPPPPGYAPTEAQYAAMQGQQVWVKKKPHSFF